MSKSQIAKAVIRFGELLTSHYQNDAEWLARFRSGDNDASIELFSSACAEIGVTLEEVDTALIADPELYALYRHVINEAVLADINPGPSNLVFCQSWTDG